jgi:hypothetical protein
VARIKNAVKQLDFRQMIGWYNESESREEQDTGNGIARPGMEPGESVDEIQNSSDDEEYQVK